jgi:hypothetical protein
MVDRCLRQAAPSVRDCPFCRAITLCASVYHGELIVGPDRSYFNEFTSHLAMPRVRFRWAQMVPVGTFSVEVL